MFSKYVRLWREVYIKLSDIADRSNLTLSTTLNVIINRVLRNKKDYKFVYDSDLITSMKLIHKRERENNNLISFHWVVTKESLNNFYKIKNYDWIKTYLTEELLVNYLINSFKGFKVKTIEKSSSRQKRLLNLVEHHNKYTRVKYDISHSFED